MSYSALPDRSFWRRCLASGDFRLRELYDPKVLIAPEATVATAGSCFAQKIGHELRASSARFLDLEPVPAGLTPATAAQLGFGLFSARFGNIYSTAQLLQLAEDAFADHLRDETFWEKDGRWFDGLRPRLEPGGYPSRDMAEAARLSHLAQLRRMFLEAEVFIFTLGLTERWQDARTGTVYPLCPAVVDPAFADPAHVFHNARVAEVIGELDRTIALLSRLNPDLRFIFTVSPVPLMATATGGHVLGATSRSKAVLRAAVDEVCANHAIADYFPSYEIATQNPTFRDAFGPDQREVRPEVVETIMDIFFAGQTALTRRKAKDAPDPEEAAAAELCDEVLLAAARG